MLSHKKSRGLTDGFEVERTGHVPSPTDLQGMEKRLVDDTVKVGFALGGEAGVKLRLGLLYGKNPNARRQMEVQGTQKGGGGMRGGERAGGNLTQSMNAAIGPTGAGHVNRFAKDAFEGGFEGKLNRGVRILTLPAVKFRSAVGEGEFEGLSFQGGTEGGGDRL